MNHPRTGAPLPLWLTPQDLMELLGISRRTLFNWIEAGKVPEPVHHSPRKIRWRSTEPRVISLILDGPAAVGTYRDVTPGPANLTEAVAENAAAIAVMHDQAMTHEEAVRRDKVDAEATAIAEAEAAQARTLAAELARQLKPRPATMKGKRKKATDAAPPATEPVADPKPKPKGRKKKT